MIPSPADHPNATTALIFGYVASALVYGAHRLGVTLTPEEAATGASALIGLVLFAAGKAKPKPPTS